jgi:methionyl-tRNA formyltransferase
MGHGKWACMVLVALVAEGYRVVGVVTEPDEFDKKEKETYRRFAKFGAYDSLKEVARCLKLLVYQPRNVNSEEFLGEMKRLTPQYIIAVSYHQIIGRAILDVFKDRIFNIHFGLLPYYRGRAPINWAIINGEKRVGITVHQMTEEVDAGPILLQKVIRVSEDERAIDVLLRGLPCFPVMILKVLDLAEKKKLKPVAQSPFEGSYFPRRKPEDGLIAFSRETSLDIHNKVRALAYPYPGAFALHNREKVVIEETALPHMNRKISPVPGIIFGKTKEGGVKVTTLDGFIIIEKVRKDERILKASEYFKVGSILE